MLTFDQLCGGLDVEISAFALCDVREDAAFTISEDTNCSLHYILAGEGRAFFETGESFTLAPHCVVIIPPGTRITFACHVEKLTNKPDPSCVPLVEDWQYLTVGESSGGMTLACGYVTAHYMQAARLFDFLREPLVDDVSQDRSFREAFENLMKELSDPKPGTRVLSEMLMKQCLIAFLRRQSENSGACHVPWLAALGDPSLGRALRVMMDKPQENHTLESLGSVAGMSRGAFAEHFKSAFGRTAIDYLKEIRLRRAAQLLASTNLPIKTIAHRVGFESRSYFSRAFKELNGIDPAGFRASPAAVALNPGAVRSGFLANVLSAFSRH